jgi:hypothetical protein
VSLTSPHKEVIVPGALVRVTCASGEPLVEGNEEAATLFQSPGRFLALWFRNKLIEDERARGFLPRGARVEADCRTRKKSLLRGDAC